MKSYKAYLVIDNVLTPIEFSTTSNPIEYLWGMFGMDTFIDSLEEVVPEDVPDPIVFTTDEEVTEEEGNHKEE